MNAKNKTNTPNNSKGIVLRDLDVGAAATAVRGGQATQTAGGGNSSGWAKIKSIMFGVDASFF